MDWTSKNERVFVIRNIRILFFEVLSSELYYSFTFIGLYYYHINFWVTTSWYLVFLGSSKEFTFFEISYFAYSVLFIKMYRFSRGRTKPQAILMLCSFMMFIVVAINVFVYLLIPQYSIYGDQHYAFTANVCNNLVILDTRERERFSFRR
jgi:hypothetical protein